MISKYQALTIAAKHAGLDMSQLQISKEKPVNAHPYWPSPLGPCWWVFAPWDDGLEGQVLRSSRVILVSKRDGSIAYDGDAADEG